MSLKVYRDEILEPQSLGVEKAWLLPKEWFWPLVELDVRGPWKGAEDTPEGHGYRPGGYIFHGVAPGVLEAKLAAAIEERIFSKASWVVGDGLDTHTRSTYPYLAIVRHLLVLRQAVRLGDYGVIREMVRNLPLLFYGGCKATDYGARDALFRVAWRDFCTQTLLTGTIPTVFYALVLKFAALQPAVVAGSNLLTWRSTSRNNRNSTHNAFVTFIRLAVLGPYTAAIRKTLENQFGAGNRGTHTVPSTSVDQIEYACTIHRDSRTRAQRGVPDDVFDAPDLWADGVSALLRDKLRVFNAKEIRPRGVVDQVGVRDILYGEEDFVSGRGSGVSRGGPVWI
ncbi:hypothetical protein B0T24DRAFT_600284 [Lasiosphaeria ovina]|uniref:Uncharacterized protein n=1 Tax=Lasiosphaeria ovina TaxID=92902 RepID=A0AAE0JRJ9_9PEZI|nr:hypothetical protein B0T24DRAFT_600284 [Lasiosphaeria ovina]